MTLTPEQLRALARAANLTLEQLDEHEPALARALDAAVRASDRERASAVLSMAPEPVRRHTATLADRPRDVAPLAHVRATLGGDDVRRAVVDRVAEDVRRVDLFNDVDRTRPIGTHPEIARLVEAGRAHNVASVAGLPADVATAVVDEAGGPAGLTTERLLPFVERGVLSREQAETTAFSALLYELLDGDAAMATALRAHRFEGADAAPTSTVDLAAVTREQWADFMTVNELSIEDEPTAVTSARLSRRFGALYPGAALSTRLPQLPPESVDDEALRAVVRGYPGLVDSIVDDPERDMPEKVAIARRHIDLVRGVFERRARAEVFDLDLSAGSDDVETLGLDEAGATEEERELVVASLRSYQRAWMLSAHDVDTTMTLVTKGFHSATAIGRLQLAVFSDRAGIGRDRARPIWEDARALMADAGLTAGSIADLVGGSFEQLAPGNTSPAARDHLAGLAGFEDLFGSLSLCACEHCQSVLGPAAYFVDLMEFVADNILHQLDATQEHPLDLRTRRPDLWTLELTCANTTERVPTLDIVNRVLENDIARRLGHDGPADDRDAIEALVYEQTLATQTDSFRAPFHLGIERVAAYLRVFGTSRADVARAIAAPAATLSRAQLGVAQLEWDLIATLNVDLAELAEIYGLSFAADDGGVAPVDAHQLARAMGISRDALGLVAQSWFVAAGGSDVRVVSEKRSPDSVQNDIERVHGLTADGLDRMHRLVRLVRSVGWSVSDVDAVLSSIGSTTLDASDLATVATVHAALGVLDLSVAEAAALVGTVPDSLVAEAFNRPAAVAADGAYPAPSRRFVHPSFRVSTDAPSDASLRRLTRALAMSSHELAALIRFLAPSLERDDGTPLDPDAADESQRYFVLSLENLSLLYRHARFARALDAPISSLLALLRLTETPVVSSESLQPILDVHGWVLRSEYSYRDLAALVGHVSRETDADRVLSRVASQAGSLRFKDTVFALALGTTEQASREILASNPGLVEPAASDAWWLVAGVDVDVASITLPPDITVPVEGGTRAITEADVRAVLRPYRADALLVRVLASVYASDEPKLRALAALANQPLTTEQLARAVRGDGPTEPIVNLLEAMAPLVLAFRNAVWDSAAIDFVRANPGLFGEGEFPRTLADGTSVHTPYLTLEQLRGISTYAQLATPLAEDGRVELRDLLLSFDPGASDFPATSAATLDTILDVASGVSAGLRGRLTLSSVAAHALAQYREAARLAHSLGIDGETLAAIATEDYAAAQRAADALMVSAHGGDEGQVAATEDAEQGLREQRRDALVDLLTRSVAPSVFDGPEDLYHYFLLDVMTSGCTTTSPVVAAISSVQLFVHRVLMNLEQDDLPPGDPGHHELRLPPEAAAEWTWRKNYRVWEANRKVFLWPENYLEPDLRDNKTPLFRELEQELLQTDITDQQVLDAYAKYLGGFEELASMTIAGAYHDVRHDDGRTTDVLHLFGVSAGDPPTYYYRSCGNLIAGDRSPIGGPLWSPWQKINVQITGRRVAPVVHVGRLHAFWVDTKTRPVSVIREGESEFAGYRHQLSVQFTSLRPDGAWSPPQRVELPANWFWPGGGTVLDDLDARGIPRYDTREHQDAIDDYTLRGPAWEGLWPEPIGDDLHLCYRNFLEQARADLFQRDLTDLWPNPPAPSPRPQVLCARREAGEVPLFFGTPILWWANQNSLPNAVIDEANLDTVARDLPFLKAWMSQGLYETQIASCPSDVQLLAVPGSIEDGLLQIGNDILLLQHSATDGAGYTLQRLGTTLVQPISRRLFEGGVDALLATDTQLALEEADPPLTLVGDHIADRSNRGTLDFGGPYGVYYQELFFHIPALIANALSSRGRYPAAQRWYHYIFDPAATEVIDVPPGTPPEEIAHRLLDRVWRYRQFRNLDVERVRDVLTDEVAIELYRRHPFNPHTIARRRISAYQKAIVMKYVDNLLDWADSLFAQFTMESVNEALMLYVMAQDVLGPRPASLGDCGEGAVEPKTYENIAPLIDNGDDFLIELESWIIGRRLRRTRRASVRDASVVSRPAVARAVARHALRATHDAGAARAVDGVSTVASAPAVSTGGPLFRGLGWTETRIAAWGPNLGDSAIAGGDNLGGRAFDNAWSGRALDGAGRFGWSIVRQLTPVFCVPANRTLLGYWDRVEDRLFKIRHCMDITGQKRELALFAPELDPALIGRIKAEGLTLEDVLDATSGDLPPYRFLYLIDRARAFASSLSGFGASLLTALEKKDAEELSRLRVVHQQNLGRLTTQIRRLDILTAEQALASVRRQLDSARYREEFYQALIDEDRTAGEIAESTARHGMSAVRAIEASLGFSSGVLALLPQLGSPFAMKYGGLELSGSMNKFSIATGTLAAMLDAVAASTGLEANLARRREGWRHQRELASQDVASLERQARAAELQLEIAERALRQHERVLDQLDEVLDLMDGSFTGLGLYTFLSAQLQRLYRETYKNAIGLARLAERAFRYERGDDSLPGLAPSYWDGSKAGLLAGERLLVDLQTLERTFLQTNYRELEVDQAFALSQIDPRALVQLRQTGECEFEIVEAFFDLFYPGHYKRRIKNARLTIPCITGPYTNISATLELVRSWVREAPTPNATMTEVPASRSTSIATSTGQNDAGVFELSFRDERYMPFEGAGAVSRWRLTLPKSFRQFDYDTINDVLLSLSYTAQSDSALRAHIETENAELEGSILHYFANNSARRVISLRQEMSAVFTRLIRSPISTAVPFDLTDRILAPLFRGRPVRVERGLMAVRTSTGGAAGLRIVLDDDEITGFAPEPTLGDIPAAQLPGEFSANLLGDHSIAVVEPGDLGASEEGGLKPDSLGDLMIYLELTLGSS